MTFNRKLIIAGFAVGVSAYAIYKLSKKREKEKIAAGQHYQWSPTPMAMAGVGGAAVAGMTSMSAPSHSPAGGRDVMWAALRDENHIADILSACVTDQHLYAFYNYERIEGIARHIAKSGALYEVCQAWQLPPSLGQDLVKLALFDISFLLDDSASMRSEGHLRRDALKAILKRAADAGASFDPDGMEVAWMNGQSHSTTDRLRSGADASSIVSKCKYDGKATPMGTALEAMLQRNILSRAESNAMPKPALVIVITDGRPTGASEHNDKIIRVIQEAKDRLARTQYGPDAISFSICAVGNDSEAQSWLDEIDSNPQIGGLIDVTSDQRREAQQVQRATGIELTEELYCLKVLLGGIDSSYDASDETSPGGGHRSAARKSSANLNHTKWEAFETQRYHSQVAEAFRHGVPPPPRPPFVKEPERPYLPPQNAMPGYGGPPAPSQNLQAGWPPSQYIPNAQVGMPSQGYGGSPFPPSQPPCMAQASSYPAAPPTYEAHSYGASTYGAPPSAASSYGPSSYAPPPPPAGGGFSGGFAMPSADNIPPDHGTTPYFPQPFNAP